MIKRVFASNFGSIFILVSVVLGTGWIVQSFRNPNQANLVAAMSMDMKEMKPTIGVVPVAIDKVQKRDISNRVSYTGTVVAYEEPLIYSRVKGRIRSINVYPGDKVGIGKLLVRLDAQELDTQVEQAQIDQEMAHHGYKIAQNQAEQSQLNYEAFAFQIRQAQQEVKSAWADFDYWQKSLKRESYLLEQGAISQEEFDKVQTAFAKAQAGYKIRKKRVNELKLQQKAKYSKIKEFNHRIEHTQVGINKARTKTKEKRIIANYQRIYATQPGVVTKRFVSPGTLVNSQTPILKIASIDKVRIQLKVSEKDLHKLHVGSILSFHSAGRPDDEFEDKVTAIFPEADPQSRTHIVESVVTNYGQNLLPGQHVQASLVTEELQETPAIPKQAIIQLDGLDKVWTVNLNRAELKDIDIVAEDSDWVAIEGLEVGTQVITNGYQDLRDGQKVAGVIWTDNGPERLPDAGVGEKRLKASSNWQLKEEKDGYNLVVTIQPQPPVAGNNTLQLRIEDKQKKPISNVSIELKTSMPNMSMGGPTLIPKESQSGTYEASTMMMSGLWRVNGTITIPNQKPFPLTFEFSIP